MNVPIEQLPIDNIIVGDRLRTDMGDIDGLAESIQEHGLLHPLIVDDNGTLIAGHRRLKALRQLGFLDVSVRRWGTLDAGQRRVIELEENVRRKDLTDAERSRKVVQLAEAVSSTVFGEFPKNPKGGRPPKYEAPRQKIAEFIGETENTIRDAETHVAAVDTYPFLEQPGWKQYHAMEAAEALDKLPEEERPAIAKLIDQPGIPPRDAIRTLQNVANKPEPERKKIIELSQSADERDRSRALTTAAAVPPMPDPRLGLYRQARDFLKKAIKLYPSDPEVSETERLIDSIDVICDGIRERTKDADVAAD